MAEPQRDLTPEQAAQRLRGLPDLHYLNIPQSADDVTAAEGVDPTDS